MEYADYLEDLDLPEAWNNDEMFVRTTKRALWHERCAVAEARALVIAEILMKWSGTESNKKMIEEMRKKSDKEMEELSK
jgi:hypothetical protein